MKKFSHFQFTFLFTFIIGAFLLSNLFKVSALSYVIDGVVTGEAQLTGASAGNRSNFDVDISLSTIPANMNIDSAVLQYSTSGISSTGSVNIIDKYKPSITNTIDISSLGTEGLRLSNKILPNIIDWYANSSHNFGINFTGKNLNDTDNIIFNSIRLIVITSSKDSTAPVITKKEITSSGIATYLFSIDTDESSKIVINIGKSSKYDQVFNDGGVFSTTHSIPITGLQSGITYHYQIIASDVNGNELKTTDNTFLTGVTIQTASGEFVIDSTLFPPNNFSHDLAKKSGVYSVLLSWTPSINDPIDGYIIYRKLSDLNNYVEIGKATATSLGYTDETVEAGLEYDYSIHTYYQNKISSNSSDLSVEVPTTNEDGSSLIPSASNNTGQVLLILFAVAGVIYLIVYGAIRFFPKIFKKDAKKQALKNILKDPSLYEESVTSEFGTGTASDSTYPEKEPLAGRDMN